MLVIVCVSSWLAGQEYIDSHTKLSTKTGHLYVIRGKKAHYQANADSTALDEFGLVVGFDEYKADDYDSIVRKKWQVVHFSRACDADRMFELLSTLCDVVAVGVAGETCSAIYHRIGYSKPKFSGFIIERFYTPKLFGKANSDDIMFRCIEAWWSRHNHVLANFATYSPGVGTEYVMVEWANYTEVEIQTEIIDCCVKQKMKTGTPRERFVAENHADLMKLRKLRSVTADITIVKISDSSVLEIKIFLPKPSELQCWRRDASDGSMQRFTVKQFIYDGSVVEHTKYALVIYGAPKLAKTPFAKSVATCLARLHQRKSLAEPYVIVVNTADSLPRGGDARMKSGVVLVFDDLRPGEARLNRPAHSVEDMKVLGDIADGGDMSARYSDIHFEPMMPRLFTSNASSPREFFDAFPYDLDVMSNAEVLSMNPHALALVKRYAFCKVEQCLIPQSVRDAYEASRSAQVLEVGAEIFAGADEIP